MRTQSALEAAEVAIVLVDSSQPMTEQDQRVITMVIESGRALVIAMNKADLVDADRRAEIDRELDRDLARVPWATPDQHLRAQPVAVFTGWHPRCGPRWSPGTGAFRPAG